MPGKFISRWNKPLLTAICCAPLLTIPTGCATGVENTALGVGAGAGLGVYYLSRTPSNEIEQTYYLGVMDPEEQLPSTLYRVRVHGQASAFSGVKFGSGWVPAPLVDSLSTSYSFDDNGKIATKTGSSDLQDDADGQSELSKGRRLVLFGPEGFRPAPRFNRLVLVMGGSPDKFFNAIDQVMGELAGTQSDTSSGSSTSADLSSDENKANANLGQLDAIKASTQPSAQ